MTPAGRWGKAAKAIDAALKAKERESSAVAIAFPVGCQVEWEHGEHRASRSATVVGHGYERDLIVEGRTGKRYRIDAWRVLRYHGFV